MSIYSFDIETEPQDEEHLLKFCPEFDEEDPKYQTGNFDPGSVKTGNLKDPKKIADKIESAREAHKKEMAARLAQKEIDRENHPKNFIRDCKAALDPAMGRVCAIGVANDSNDFAGVGAVGGATESDVIRQFWSVMKAKLAARCTLVGHNIFEFDLPFLIVRSDILGIDVPKNIVSDRFGKWPRFHSQFIDTRKVWLTGRHPGSVKSSFAHLAAAFGTSGKFDGVDGKDFSAILREDSDKAYEYLRQDCLQPLEWARRMGVV